MNCHLYPVHIIALCILLGGCTIPAHKASEPLLQVQTALSGQGDVHVEQLAKARRLLEEGKEQAALRAMEKLAAEPGHAGVTDEVLFRMAILYLRPEESNGLAQCQDTLERLQKDYPKSQWSLQAAPLLEFIGRVRNTRVDLSRQLRTLKDTNLSLTKENKELRQNIEKLKNLDLELEQKIKH